MSIFHMYTGDDGQSHIEEPALSAQPSQETPQATQEIFFRELPSGTAMDWHNAPRRVGDGPAVVGVVPVAD